MRYFGLPIIFFVASIVSCPESDTRPQSLAAVDCNQLPEPKSVDELFNLSSQLLVCVLNDVLDSKKNDKFFFDSGCKGGEESTLNNLNFCGSGVSGDGRVGCKTETDCAPGIGCFDTEVCEVNHYDYKISNLRGLGGLRFSLQSTTSPQETAQGWHYSMTLKGKVSGSVDSYAELKGKLKEFIPEVSYKGNVRLNNGTELSISLVLDVDLDCGRDQITANVGKISIDGLSLSYTDGASLIFQSIRGILADKVKGALEGREALPKIINNFITPKMPIPNLFGCPSWGCELIDDRANTGKCVGVLEDVNGTTRFNTSSECASKGNCGRSQGFRCQHSGTNFFCAEDTGSAEYAPSSPGLTSYQACKKECPCAERGYQTIKYGRYCLGQCGVGFCDSTTACCSGSCQMLDILSGRCR